MSISAVNAAASFEAPKPAKTTGRSEPAPVSSAPSVSAAGTQPVVTSENAQMQQGTYEQSGGQSQPQDGADKRLRSAVSEANHKLKQTHTKCEFSYHEGTKRVSIKVMNKETNEVIREIPPEETLEMVEKMWELAGILVDEKR